MIPPGVQAIFGFQLIAAFNQRFELLGPLEQWLHFGALFLIVLAMTLLMFPAAYHRIASPTKLSERLVHLSSIAIATALVPLIASVTADVYVVARLIKIPAVLCFAAAVAVAAAMVTAWVAAPGWGRRQGR